MPAQDTCPFCGASVSPAARYCDHCGTPLKTAESASPRRQPRQTGRVAVWLFVIVLILIFSGGAAGGYRYGAGNWPFSIPAIAHAPTNAANAAEAAADPAAAEFLRSVVAINARGGGGNRAGSGFLMDTAGNVVTAAHVVEGAEGCVTVFDDNGTAHQGTVVGRNQNLDIALIRVPTLSSWPAHLTLGNSSRIQRNESVLPLGSPKAIGRAVPLKASVTALSGSQTIDGRYYGNLIQFEGATVIDGTSGGPLVAKASGKVVGIVTAAGNGPVAWAIPMNDVQSLLTQWAITPVTSCSSAAAAKITPVELAGILPLSGSYGVWGSDLADGAQLAIRDTQSALQAAGFSVTLKTFDDQGLAARAQEMASTAAYDPQVIGVVGSLESQATLAIAQTLKNSGLVMVAPTAGADELTTQGWPFFNRLVASSRHQEQAAARYAQTDLKAKAVFLVDEGTTDAVRQAASFQAAAQVISLPIAGHLSLGENWKYDDVKKNLLDAKADAIYYAGGADNALRLIAQLRQDGVLIPILGGESLYDPRFEHLVGPGANSIYFTRLTAEPADPFQRHFESVMGKPTRGYAAFGYDAASLILNALVRYGDAHPGQVPSRSELARLVRETSGYSGWSSFVTFDANGENLSAWIYLFEWNQGSLVHRKNLR